MRRLKTTLGIGAVSISLVALGLFAGLANAQTPAQSQTPTSSSAQTGPHPVRLIGKVSTISGTTLTVTTKSGDETVNTDATTWIVVSKNSKATQGTLSDVQSGKEVVVAGMTTNDPKVVDARVITQGNALGSAVAGKKTAPGQLAGRGNGKAGSSFLSEHMVIGTVKSISGSTITLTGLRGEEVVVNTTSSTVVLNNGFQSVSSLKVGDKVQVLGQAVKATAGAAATTPTQTPSTSSTPSKVPATRTINAYGLRVDNSQTQIIVGRVSAVNGNSITLQTPRNRNGITLTLDGNTAYKSLAITAGQPALSNAAQSDIKAGSNILVEGTISASNANSATAKAVIIMPQGKASQ
ncbi:MAG: hypothetical protein IVW55_11705 [Chloroflexi bacterium]|nr:hypothetical protein [Chloroflexota bacterium]